jgi:hypothetical protein
MKFVFALGVSLVRRNIYPINSNSNIIQTISELLCFPYHMRCFESERWVIYGNVPFKIKSLLRKFTGIEPEGFYSCLKSVLLMLNRDSS